ncbi:MAG TPA: FtsX-like permease family protein, partial [Candidatus Saccharimonadales bacterium]|nr:FtsX-like permease family protein [Candidatus Saccharimonadales bacterium]
YLLPAVGRPPGLQPPVTVIGIDPTLDPLLHPQAVVAGVPLAPGTVGALVSRQLATEEGLQVGSSVALAGVASPQQSTLPIVGILADGLPDANGRLVVVPLTSAATIFGLSGVTRVDVGLTPGADPNVVSGALESRITTQPYTISARGDVAAALRASTADFQSTAALIAAVALFVGAFLIFNTLSMTVTERIREVALLRAAGTTRSQIHSFVLLQAFVLGLLGSLLGVVVGFLLAAWLASALGAGTTIGSVRINGPSFPIDGALLAIGVGIAVTLASAMEPAWRAGRVSPVEALRRQPTPVLGGARLRWLIVVFVVVGIAGLALAPGDVSAASRIQSLAVFGVLLVATLLSPIVLPALGRVAGIPFAAILRAEERLARGAIVRDPSRTALTVGSLAIGLAMLVAVASVAVNDRRAAAAWLTDVVPGDEVATAIRPTALSEGVQDELAAVPGVARVTPIARFDLSFDGRRLDAAAVSGSDLLVDGRLQFDSGDRRAALIALDGTGAVVLPRSVANRLGLRLGDRMTFVSATGTDVSMRVAGIADRTLPGQTGEAVLVGWTDATNLFGVTGADVFAIRFAPGQAATARPLVEAKARELALQPAGLDAVQGAVNDTLGRVFGLFDVLAAIAVIVAGLGIVNTLTMNVLERVREIGVLRAAGMTQRQVWRMVVVEAGVVGILGAVLGCVLGVLVAMLMLALSSGMAALASLEVPWLTIGLAAVFAIAVAMLAAYYPARLASRLSIVRAVQYE